MATNPTADQRVAVQQARHLNGRKTRLQEEFDAIAQTAVVARRQEIQEELAAINAQLAAIEPRLPPADPPGPPGLVATKGPPQ